MLYSNDINIRFPKYGWIFPCNHCGIPSFTETSYNFECNKCTLKRNQYIKQFGEQLQMKQNDINQLRVNKKKIKPVKFIKFYSRKIIPI